MTYIPSADDLEVITREVWTSFLDGDPSGLIAESGDMPADKITGCVYLSGAYTGACPLAARENSRLFRSRSRPGKRGRRDFGDSLSV